MNTSERAEAGPSTLPPLARVLCALDVQQPHASPFGFAQMIADRFGATLDALYVGSSLTAEAASAQLELDALLRRLGSRPATSVQVASGRPAAAIVAHARAADLIVLGCRERSDLGWQFRDDVARDVAAAAPCATLTVHERDSPETIERILVPIDFGPATSRTLEWALAFALRFGAKLQLLHVVSREQHTIRSMDRKNNVLRSSVVPRDVTLELARIERRVALLGIDVSGEIVVDASTAHGIESYNQRGQVDLIVMGLGQTAQGAGRLARGVVATLRNRLPVPLLSVDSPVPSDGSAPGRALNHGRKTEARQQLRA